VLFGKEAFLPLGGPRTFHDLVREEGKVWEAKVTRDLSSLVFQEIYPSLIAALYRHDRARPATVDAYYLEEVRQSALVLLYRLLFVVYAEDRALLPDKQEPYQSYSLTTMRGDITERKGKGQVFSATIATCWQKLTAVFKAIAEGDDDLGVPPYNGGLFAKGSAPILDRVQLPDAVMADLIFKLSHRDEGDGKPRYINYRDLTVQQLGTIYERTLEYGLLYDRVNDTVLVDANDTARHESGSYYTPDSLVSLIIEKAVGPFVEERLAAFRTEAAKLVKDKRPVEVRLALLQGLDPALGILELRVCDPSMGSGHFLVNLVDWLADKALAAIAEAESIVDWSDKPYRSPVLVTIEQTRTDIIRRATVHKWPFVVEHLDDRHIVRRTILKRCIYGVDKNPMAVELAKVALWLHTFTVGAPLSFLDHHLRCGNSLFGFWLREAMDRLTKWGGQLLISEPMQKAMAQALAMEKLERVNDIDIAEVHQSKALFDGIEQETRPLNRFIMILYALEWLKLDKQEEASIRSWLDGQFGDPLEIARDRFTLGPTDAGDGHSQPRDVLDKLDARTQAEAVRFAGILNEAREVMRTERFQNWQIAFPGVWTQWESTDLQGGFDAVVGNPPYVRQELIKPYKSHLKRAFPETYDGVADLYVYFYDQGLKLLKAGGRLSYVVTNKWLRAGYAEGLRGLFADKAWVEFIADFGHAKKFFPDADVFPSVLVVRKPISGAPPNDTQVCVIPRDDVPERALDEAVAKATYRLPLTHFTRSSWTLEPPAVSLLLRKIREGNETLEAFSGVKPLYGIKTGLNEAFLIDTPTKERLVAVDPKAAQIIKPYLRGQDIERWWSPSPGLWMIFARRGIQITDYPSIHSHLSKMRSRLEPKPDNWRPKYPGEKWAGRKEGNYAWYEVQDPVEYFEEFSKPKLLLKRIAFYGEFSLDLNSLHVNDSALVIRNTSPWLLTCLNSPVAWYFMFKTFPHKKDEAVALDIPFLRKMPIASQHPKFDPDDVARIRQLSQRSHEAVVRVSDWLKLEFEIERSKRVALRFIDRGADEFVAGVRYALPKKRKMSSAEIAELKREHAATIEPARQVRAAILALERKLSDLANEAYGLTPEEVERMWATAPPRMPLCGREHAAVPDDVNESEDE
jgi:hypothetical protein